jgi:tRNA threonylcarbamoyladenosine biosynthesis protein TsaB
VSTLLERKSVESRGEALFPVADSGRVLAIETASRAGSVSLFENGVEVTSLRAEAGLSQSVTLIALVDKALKAAGTSVTEIDSLVCATGPGSFTGLRIGLATVKGLSVSLNVPCVGVPTLHAVALKAGPSDCTLALLPAGRGEYFAQLLKVGPVNRILELSRAIHVKPDDLFLQLSERAELLVSHCDLEGEMRSPVDHAAMDHPLWEVKAVSGALSTSVGALGLVALEEGRLVPAEKLGALYVRPSDPELKTRSERLDRF